MNLFNILVQKLHFHTEYSAKIKKIAFFLFALHDEALQENMAERLGRKHKEVQENIAERFVRKHKEVNLCIFSKTPL